MEVKRQGRGSALKFRGRLCAKPHLRARRKAVSVNRTPVSLVPQEQPIMIAMPLQQLLAIVLVASFAAKRCWGS